MYQIFLTKTSVKEINKRGKIFKEEITEILRRLAFHPYPQQAEKLTCEMRFSWSYHFSFSGCAYRLAYTINEKEKTLTVIMAGPRENFYKSLRQKIKS